MRAVGEQEWQRLPTGPHALVGHWEWTVDTHEVVWDAAAAALLGAAAGETPQQAWERTVLAQDRSGAVRAFWAGVEATYRVRTPEGGLRTLLSRPTHTARDPERRAGVVIDVSGVGAASASASALLHSSPDAFASVDGDLRVALVNPRACEEAGRPAHELLGRPLEDLFGGDAALTDLVRGVLASGRPAGLERTTSPAGRSCQVHVVPSVDGAGLWWRDAEDRGRATVETERALVSERRARRAAEEARAVLSVQASSDALTGLANRTELTRRLGGHLARDGHAATVLFLDLDRFKEVNDTLGHAAGDELLATIADRLRQLVRASDVVARIGGDEFVVALLDDDTEVAASAAEDVAHRVLAAVREPVPVRGKHLVVSASIGVAVGTPHADVDALLHDADVALYRTKHGGRDGITWYDAELRRQVVDRLQLEVDLREAPGADQLSLAYQACLDLRTGGLTGVEALLRWQHPTRGAVAPAQCVGLAEQTGLIAAVGSWVLGTAVADSARWQHLEPFTTWVNVSAHELVRRGFADALLVRLAEADVAPWRFGVEVTESALAAGGPAEEEVARLSASGIRVAIDDFGTGYSSLARLARFPVDVLKIDRELVRGVLTRRGAAVVQGIVTLGHAIEARVVAEGVETPEELHHLREAGCDAAQGYLLGRPGPAERVLAREPHARLLT